jgi:hypothetical protein
MPVICKSKVGKADPVAARSEALAWSARTLDRGIKPRLGHGSLSFVSLRCVVLCRQRPCEELISRPSSATVYRKID